jgi:hypothetical protein
MAGLAPPVKVRPVIPATAMVGVAQLVEPRIVIPVVVGSSPIVHPNLPWAIRPRRAVHAVLYKVRPRRQNSAFASC